jgi:quercetin dioxygenase-like cupin family protein
MSNNEWQPYIVDGTTHPGVLIHWEDDEHSQLTAKLERGGRTIPHTHSGIEKLRVIHGRGVLIISGKVHKIKPGDIIQIPAGRIHCLRSLFGEMLVHATFHPPFLEQETIITAPSSV